MTGPERISSSYMELCLHLDGYINKYLRIPTVWDDIEKKWRGFIKTPISLTLIHAEGLNSFELTNDFNSQLSYIFKAGGFLAEEIFSMFHPLSYWEEMTE